MLTDKNPIKKIFKSININFVFFLILFFVWILIDVYIRPVDLRDDLVEASMQLSGISISKNHGIEYAEFNNCVQGGEVCHCKVLVHGIGDNFQNWSQVLKKVKKENKVKGHWIAFNYPGTGHSDPFATREDFRVDTFANFIDSKISKLCSGPIDIIANSMGAWISFWWVIQHPEKIDSLFFLNAVGVYTDYSWLADAMINPDLKKMKELHKRGYHTMAWYPNRVYLNTIENIKHRGNKNFILAQNKSLAVDKYLPSIKQKIFMGWGESDQVIPLSTYDFYLNKMPNITGKKFKNCGHVPNAECPDDVVKAMVNFYNYPKVPDSQW